jgi:hypothetical protein
MGMAKMMKSSTAVLMAWLTKTLMKAAGFRSLKPQRWASVIVRSQ